MDDGSFSPASAFIILTAIIMGGALALGPTEADRSFTNTEAVENVR